MASNQQLVQPPWVTSLAQASVHFVATAPLLHALRCWGAGKLGTHHGHVASIDLQHPAVPWQVASQEQLREVLVELLSINSINHHYPSFTIANCSVIMNSSTITSSTTHTAITVATGIPTCWHCTAQHRRSHPRCCSQRSATGAPSNPCWDR